MGSHSTSYLSLMLLRFLDVWGAVFWQTKLVSQLVMILTELATFLFCHTKLRFKAPSTSWHPLRYAQGY